ncbi:hypothetical protein V1525DRAFT_390191 [Lipomyces kononenkoae]|uniref:Uncharacterized protein n=1 Tax=Lipomyces kononenkoae TaxID=34357 RepID=A0ACC3SVP5_LIPKO
MSVYGEDTARTRARSQVEAAIAIARVRSCPVTAEIAGKQDRQVRFLILRSKNPCPRQRLARMTKTPLTSALRFLVDNEPAKRLDIQLSYRNFIALEEQAHALYGDAKYIANDQEMLLWWIRPTSNRYPRVGESLSIPFQRRCYNRQHLIDYVLPMGDSTNESGTGSTKTSDAGLLFDDGQRRLLTLIVEAGVSEGYRALKRDIELW